MMLYCDMHCDTLTTTQEKQITAKRLERGDCLLQCFAVFLQGREELFSRAARLCRSFGDFCAENAFHAVGSAREMKTGAVNALLTAEGGEMIEGNLQNLDTLYGLGVRMLTLTWNYPNEIGYPNFPDYEGLFSGRTGFQAREENRGLTPFGFRAVEKMKELGMIVDVSHGSDKLLRDVAEVMRGVPFVASHSNADSAFAHARNLRDDQIRTVAESGGVVGLNFCADFLSCDQSAEGQREALLAHARAVIRAGGEDVLAIGSDFDGIPPNAFLKSPEKMPDLLSAFEDVFGARVAEKIARDNYLRVFQSVCR